MTAVGHCRVCGKPDPFVIPATGNHDECDWAIEQHAREHHDGTIATCAVCLAPDPTIAERLEYLRGQIEAEQISYSELAELQSLAETDLAAFEGDVVLLEWAGVPEFPDDGVEDCHPDCGPIAAWGDTEHAHDHPQDGRCWHENDDERGAE